MMMDYTYEIIFIKKMIARGVAYEVNIPDIGNFICCSEIKKKTIPNEVVTGYLRDPSDFVIWIPKIDGVQSPWGYGIPSANLYVCCIYS